ncbi:PilD-dependent protein PddA [Sedimentisphaera cyanobacteriorum]|uniref:PilD-dependent protein PddA n=1 Tax=Sedimentisphaera cyanobacteriorum TaxID=1940790 RepID=A0A1Q2HR27_9BACT|nr:type II secretion system protein [Sedimentisphaera cyanobacteriorum]AQQ09850.1 PilD-dependent protein PddA [Sedimentisphaera cyanobacteriorum]
MTKKVNNAFTLVELLVVISIIGLLTGILMPVLSVAREQGRCVVCKSNLKNIGFALRVYLDDYEGKMPSADPYPGSYGQKSQHWFMNSVLLKNMGLEVLKDEDGELIGPGKERSVLTCPTHRHPDMTRDSPPDYPAQEREYSLSYMANGTLGVSGKALVAMEYRHESEYRRPSEAMMFCDGNGTMQTPGTVLYDGCPKSNFEFRHRGKVNAIFLDQHIESLKEEDIPFCTRFDERRFGTFWYAKKK